MCSHRGTVLLCQLLIILDINQTLRLHSRNITNELTTDITVKTIKKKQVYETRKQSMAWMEMSYKYPSNDSNFRWKIKWQLQLWDTLRIMGEATHLTAAPEAHHPECTSPCLRDNLCPN